jgi:hypothetical protein
MAANYRQNALKLLLLLTFLVPARHSLYPPWRGNTDTLALQIVKGSLQRIADCRDFHLCSARTFNATLASYAMTLQRPDQ